MKTVIPRYDQGGPMNIYMKGSVAHLQGNLTNYGVTQKNIESLSVSLQQIGSEEEKYFQIDCTKIRSADMSGLQLLYVWMQCAIFRGGKPELVNLSVDLQKAILSMGLGHCFQVTAPIMTC